MSIDKPEPAWQVDLLKKLMRDSKHPNAGTRLARNAMYWAIQHQPAAKHPDAMTPPQRGHHHPYSQKQWKVGAPGVLRYANTAKKNDPDADKACRIAVQTFCREWMAEPVWGVSYYCDDTQVKQRGLDYSKLNFSSRPGKNKVDWGRAKIIKALGQNRPVLVGLVRCHMSAAAPSIPLNEEGKLTAYHWVAIVAYALPLKSPTFLYLDPWPGGQSEAMYNKSRCKMMGYIRLKKRGPGQNVLIAENIWVSETKRGAVVLRGP